MRRSIRIAASILIASAMSAAAETVILELESVSIQKNSEQESRVLDFVLTEDGTRQFGAFTSRHIDEQIEIVVNEVVLISPIVKDAIYGRGFSLDIAPSAGNLHSIVTGLRSSEMVLEARSTQN